MTPIIRSLLLIILLFSGICFAEQNSSENYQSQVLTHLLKVFSTPDKVGIIFSRDDEMFKNYLELLEMFPRSESKRITDVAKLALHYYEIKHNKAQDLKTKQEINNEVLKLLEKTKKYFTKNPHPFSSMFFENIYKRQYETLHPEERKVESLEDVIDVEEARKKIDEIIRDYIKDLKRQNSVEIEYADTNLKVTAQEYAHRTDKVIGNVVYIGKEQQKETVFIVSILSIDQNIYEAYSSTVKSLLSHRNVYGVQFEDRVKIPSNIDLKSFNIVDLGNGQVLVKKPVVKNCSQLF